MADDKTVGETNDKTVLWRLVLVLGLNDETLTLTVVSLSLASTAELDLITRKVRLVLGDFDKRLRKKKKRIMLAQTNAPRSSDLPKTCYALQHLPS